MILSYQSLPIILFLFILCAGNHSILSAQRLSPAYIAFSMPTDGGAALMLINPDDPADLRQVASCYYACEGLAWSADRTRLGYMDDHALIVIDTDGTELQRVRINRGTYPYNVVPAWTGDLSRVVFDARYHMRSHLVLVAMDTGEITRLDVSGEKPTWSPDETQWLFTRGGQLIVRDVATGAETTLTPRGDYHDRGVWSPDGSQIAFRAGIGATDYALAVMDADGGNGRVLIAGIVESPVWSPDSSRIATIQWGDLRGRRTRLFVVDVATEQVTLLGRVDVTDFAPVWSPDGTRVATIGRETVWDTTLNLYQQPIDGAPAILIPDVADALHPPERLAW